MKSLFLLLVISIVVPCEKTMTGGFHYLKEWPIDNNKKEVSYVLTSGTEYMFRFCNSSKGEFLLEDNERRQILKLSLSQTSDIVWKSNSTGIRYLRFVDMENNSLVLGFKR
jgi:hypothetical protein